MPPNDPGLDPSLPLAVLTRDRPFDAPAGAGVAEGAGGAGGAGGAEAAAPPVVAMTACVSCGHEVPGLYCGWCGERRAQARQYTLRGFAGEAFESLTDVDGRLLRSLRALFNRPGELTARYMRGERVAWVPPLRLFLLMNVVFFLIASRFHIRIFDTPLNVQLRMQWYSGWITPMAESRVARAGVSLAQYAAVFDRVTTTQARTLVILMVPAFALAAALVNVRQRRPALHHLAFALHGYAAVLGLLVGTWAAIYLVIVGHALVTGRALVVRDGPFSLIQAVAVMAFLAVAQRGAYGDSRRIAWLKSVALVLAMGLILQGYRLLLFFVTFWST